MAAHRKEDTTTTTTTCLLEEEEDHDHDHHQGAPRKKTMWTDKLREIFPSKYYFIFFMAYVLLYISQAILIRLSRQENANQYAYNTKSVVLFTEVTKMVFAVGIYLKDHSVASLWRELGDNLDLLLSYLIPSILYCIYNNLTYINLAYYDPTTYYILLQLRIAVTGIIYQLIFKKYLNRIQWISLLLLTLGCIIKEFENFGGHGSGTGRSIFNGYLLLVFVQIFCSCFSGVYNEYLLKGKQKDVHIMIQNLCMYIDSIGCNLFVVVLTDNENIVESLFDIRIFTSTLVLIIILNNALCGISTSYFIKTFNSIMKSYATAIEVLITACLSYLLFAIAINTFTVLSIIVVSYATYLYAKHPFIPKPTTIPEKV